MLSRYQFANCYLNSIIQLIVNTFIQLIVNTFVTMLVIFSKISAFADILYSFVLIHRIFIILWNFWNFFLLLTMIRWSRNNSTSTNENRCLSLTFHQHKIFKNFWMIRICFKMQFSICDQQIAYRICNFCKLFLFEH